MEMMMKIFVSSGFHTLCPLPCWASLSCCGIYNQIKYSFVLTLPSISMSLWLSVYVCVCFCVGVCVCIMKVSAPPMELWQGLRPTQRHVQKSSCFIVCGRTELCFLQGSSKQQSWKYGEMGGGGVTRSKKNEYTLVPKLRYGLHQYGIASMCAQCIQTWTVRLTHFVKHISVYVFIHSSIKTIAHTRLVTLEWPELQSPARITFTAFMWLYALVCTTSNILRLNSFDMVMDVVLWQHENSLSVTESFHHWKSPGGWDWELEIKYCL